MNPLYGAEWSEATSCAGLGRDHLMNITRYLRPTQKLLTATVVAAVAATCLVSASGGTLAAPGQGSQLTPKTSATKEWRSRQAPVAPGNRLLTMKEWRKAPTRLEPVAQSAYPALSTTTYEQRTARRINEVRRSHGLRSLRFASCTNRVANRWSAHLAATNSLYHQSMTRLLRVCHAHYAGETLGQGSVSPRTLVRMWMHSPPHRQILMSGNPRRIGIGATPNSSGQWVVAANFMRF